MRLLTAALARRRIADPDGVGYGGLLTATADARRTHAGRHAALESHSIMNAKTLCPPLADGIRIS